MATLLLAGCIPSSEPRRAEPSRGEPRAARSDPTTRQCLADLARDGIEFEILPDRRFGGGCSAIGAVQLLDIGTPTANLGAMTCPLAREYARWTRQAVQPAARNWLGSQVVKIESFGTYACRPVNGMAGGKLSEHGRANAVDISAFVLRDGRRITVLEGWNSDDDDVRAFLRAVHQAGCRRFGITLGPEANSLHHNHFHFDMGQGPYCR
ncbi:extensin family protein [Allosphingosinicella sp.]|uniref:extensin family protein n=1 Tax=Allosphingosinicella sp. TaxID=2823234 RepID=UPI002FC20E87